MTNYYRTMRIRKNDSLRHHGIEGMRWGIRRYQNRDGSLTELGRRRLGREPDIANIHTRVSKDYEKAIGGINSASKGFNSASNISSRIKKNSDKRKNEKAKKSIDLSRMSDKELQQAVNRLNLERNYKSLMTEDIVSGSDYVSDILSTAGDVAAIGASVAGIAMAIHAIRGA